MLDTFTLGYHPNETENLTADPELQRKLHGPSIRALAKAAGVSTKTVRAAREGKRLRKSTIDKLEKALSSEFKTIEPRSVDKDTQFRLDDPE
jgi:transcriptional regulator with XRE-family HTH domain